MSSIIRYSDKELEEFRQLIESKLDKTKEQLKKLYEQIREITENADDEFGNDWFDDSSTNNEVDYLSNMAGRQEKYLKSLESALLRIRNKTYGICTVSGQLIDKKRLMAVPTTTKSLEAKLDKKEQGSSGSHQSDDNKVKGNPVKKKTIISKVIKKSKSSGSEKSEIDESLDFLDEENEVDFLEDTTLGLDDYQEDFDEVDEDDRDE